MRATSGRPFRLVSIVVSVLAVLPQAGTRVRAQSGVLSPASPPRDGAIQRTGTGVIRGRTTTAGSNAISAIPAVRVSLSGGPTAPSAVFTDDAGRFEFSGLAAGRYTITAEKTSFARTRYGATNDIDLPLPIDVADGAMVGGIEVRMPRAAAISGRVVDDVGEPAVTVPIALYFLQRVGNETRLVRTDRSTLTDERGQYRIGGLSSGRYVLAAGGSTTWLRAFFDSASTARDATPIVLATSQERTGVDLVSIQAQPGRLAVMLNDQSGNPVQGVTVLSMADPTGESVRKIAVPMRGMTPTLDPGEWLAVAMPQDEGLTAFARFTVASGQKGPLELVARPGARLAGRVVFEGAASPPANTRLRVTARVNDSDEVTRSATPRADGTFDITNLIGTIHLEIAAPPPGWALGAVRSGNRDLMNEPLTLEGGESIAEVQVILTNQIAEISGSVSDATGRPSPGCPVALFPDVDDSRIRSRGATLQRADQNGRFRFIDQIAGRYLAIAASDIDSAVWLTPESLDRLSSAATRVTLIGREPQRLTLRCGVTP